MVIRQARQKCLSVWYLNKIRSGRKLEQECCRNIELRWLMQQYSEALKNLFKLYVHFLDELSLLGKQSIAADGSKFRAVNSRKNHPYSTFNIHVAS
jgi:transposase